MDSEFKGDSYKQQQQEARKRVRMGHLYDEKKFFDRGSKAAKNERRQRRLKRRQLLREYKGQNGGKRLIVTK